MENHLNKILLTCLGLVRENYYDNPFNPSQRNKQERLNYFIITCLKRSGFAEEISFVGNEARRDHDREGFWFGGDGVGGGEEYLCMPPFVV